MELATLLEALRERGIRLQASGDQLRVSAPAGTMSGELKAAIAHHKPALLAAFRESAPRPALARGSADEPAALSPTQERIWLFQELDPSASTYNVSQVMHLDGPLDVERLSRAVTRLAERHEPLRSLIVRGPSGVPEQRVLPPAASILRVEDLSFLSAADRERAAAYLVRQEQHRPFDLARDSPFRALLLILGDDRYHWIATFHHAWVDGSSLIIAFRDLIAMYGGWNLPDLPVRFRDYARWERATWQGARLQGEVAFWRSYLAGAPTELALPADRMRPPTQTFTGARVATVLSGEPAEALQSFVRQERASVFAALVAAFAAALHRMSGQRDFVLGTPVAGRSHQDLEQLVGMFVNQLPLRAHVERGASFRRLLAAARSSVAQALSHAELPFAMLLDALELPRDRSRTPLFQAMVNVLPPLQDTGSWRVGDLAFTSPSDEELHAALDVQARFDLTLYAQPIDNQVRLWLAYNRDLYSEARAAALFDQVLRILEAGVRAPDTPLEEALPHGLSRTDPNLGERSVGERRGEVHDRTSVVARFRSVAARHSDRPAVVDALGAVTYARLLAEVEALAAELAGSSEEAGPVGIYVGHERRMAVAVLGVLTAGRPYVPLDPRYPVARLAQMVADAGVTRIVAPPELAAEAARIATGVPVTTMDGSRSEPGGDHPTLLTGPSPDPGPDATAYLLFTSGSTGTPKAVYQSHANLVLQAERYADAVDMRPTDTMAILASMSFDAFLMDFFGALLRGAAIAPIDVREADLAELPLLTARLGVTLLHTTPTVIRTVATAARGQRFEGLRALVLGGEPARARDVQYFDAAFPADAILYSLYGCAEHSFALGCVVPRDLANETVEVPLGWPVGDVEVVLLDPDGGEDAVSGEIALRSAHGALGYWRRPDLTEVAWVPDPGRPDRSVYRTGDFARRRADGALVFLHRRDGQLKIRGHRVEPSEVEAVLARHPGVREAAVHGTHTRDGVASLVACVALAADVVVQDSELAAWTAERLPSFMVPTVWVRLDALPRTPTGKVDRKALPGGADVSSGEAGYLAPRNAEEGLVAEIWAEVLGRRVDEIGVLDDFFALGGHSLTATQVVARVREVLGVELALRDFFERPTIADVVAGTRSTSAARSAPPLGPAPEGPAPLSFSQERMWFLQQLAPEASAYNVVTALVVDGPLDLERWQAAISRVVSRHEALRTRIVVQDGRPVQVVSPASEHEVLFEDLTGVSAEGRVAAAARRLGGFAGEPFDLAKLPALRAIVLKVDAERHLVALCVHHALFDLWSREIVLRDLAAAYNAAASEPSSATVDGVDAAERPLQYRDYAHWQRTWLTGEALEAEVEYWRSALAGLEPLDLPTDLPRPKLQTFNGSQVVTALPAGLDERIRQSARDTGVTPFVTLLAAFNALLHAHSRQVDVAVGVPIANRTRRAVEGMVGTFVNTLVHRNDLSGDPTFRELVGRVRATALEAFAHQDVPFEAVVRELNLPRDTSRSPLFQVMFNLAAAPVDVPPIEGLAVRHFAVDRGAAQFDLLVNVSLDPRNAALALSYNTDLFEEPSARRYLEHYLTILDRATANPGMRLAELTAVPQPERRLLLDDWNRSERPAPAWPDLPSAVLATAARLPDRIAVTTDEGNWTYQELLDASQRVSAQLMAMGVQPGARVLILMERSREMLASLLGVLGAGAAYVPLDPTYPEARVRHVLENSGAAAMITHRSLDARLGIDVPVLDLDRWAPPAPAPFRPVRSDDAAYVIYTSGSTGLPKGVEIGHGALANFLASMAEEPGLAEGEVLLAVTTISFDIAVLELYLPLVVGARVVIVSESEAFDGTRLAHRMEAEGATLMQATPATWKLLIAAGWQGRPGLRVLCGGEPLPRSLADDLLARVGEVWNMYGPTETTVWSTLERVSPEGPISIGHPIANTTIYILDDALQPVPIGVPGELWIGGAGVAKGYVGQPDLTAERFVASPFRPGERIYRTGDLARRRADGRLEHLGRLDHQVKVRGFRIELGEVETILRRHPGVRDAVVVARDERLVAYLIHELDAPTVSELRAWVADALPAYMMPSLFVPLEAFPLTPNGKVDRKRLPAPTAPAMERRRHQPPTSEAERALAAVWSELLSVETIGVSDNFFELGGHSLLAMQAVSLVEARTGHRVEPRALFFKTLGQLAESMQASGRSA